MGAFTWKSGDRYDDPKDGVVSRGCGDGSEGVGTRRSHGELPVRQLNEMRYTRRGFVPSLEPVLPVAAGGATPSVGLSTLLPAWLSGEA